MSPPEKSEEEDSSTIAAQLQKEHEELSQMVAKRQKLIDQAGQRLHFFKTQKRRMTKECLQLEEVLRATAQPFRALPAPLPKDSPAKPTQYLAFELIKRQGTSPPPDSPRSRSPVEPRQISPAVPDKQAEQVVPQRRHSTPSLALEQIQGSIPSTPHRAITPADPPVRQDLSSLQQQESQVKAQTQQPTTSEQITLSRPEISITPVRMKVTNEASANQTNNTADSEPQPSTSKGILDVSRKIKQSSVSKFAKSTSSKTKADKKREDKPYKRNNKTSQEKEKSKKPSKPYRKRDVSPVQNIPTPPVRTKRPVKYQEVYTESSQESDVEQTTTIPVSQREVQQILSRQPQVVVAKATVTSMEVANVISHTTITAVKEMSQRAQQTTRRDVQSSQETDETNRGSPKRISRQAIARDTTGEAATIEPRTPEAAETPLQSSTPVRELISEHNGSRPTATSPLSPKMAGVMRPTAVADGASSGASEISPGVFGALRPSRKAVSKPPSRS